MAELERVEAKVQLLERFAPLGLEDAGGAQALIRRLGPIVDPPDAVLHADPGDQLLHGLEEVHVEAQQAIDGVEGRIAGLGGEAIIADPPPDDGAVLLLDVGTVVLAVRATAGEGDPLALAVAPECGFRSIVISRIGAS